MKLFTIQCSACVVVLIITRAVAAFQTGYLGIRLRRSLGRMCLHLGGFLKNINNSEFVDIF